MRLFKKTVIFVLFHLRLLSDLFGLDVCSFHF